MRGLVVQTTLLTRSIGGLAVDVFVFNGSEHHAYQIQVTCDFSLYGREFQRTAVVGDLRPKFGLMFAERDFGYLPFGTYLYRCRPVGVE